MNLIDRIAKAFWEREYTSPWDEAPDRAKIDFRDHARLAVREVVAEIDGLSILRAEDVRDHLATVLAEAPDEGVANDNPVKVDHFDSVSPRCFVF